MLPRHLSSVDPVAPRSTRRRFLGQVSAGLALGWWGRRGYGQSTGVAVPKLAALDDLMNRFMSEHKPPGVALAVTYRSRLVYARGFGLADKEKQEPVQPSSLFRIASLSKPFTSTAVFRLVEKGKLKLDDPVFPILKLEPHFEPGDHLDPRWHDITVRHCLQHTGGWDRGKSFDPMSAATAEDVAKALGVSLPITATQIIRYTMGKPLDHDPGKTYAYSNFGYCVIGRIIEAVSGKPYHEFVSSEVLSPLGIRRMRLGMNLLKDRASDEVKYYDGAERTSRAISGPDIGKQAPLPYGVECIETMDANGGWIASVIDLVRFAAALDEPGKCPILSEAGIRAMLAPPPGAVGHTADGKPRPSYYACGWNVQPPSGETDKWAKSHSGLLAGSSTHLACRADGIDWAVCFNCDADRHGKEFGGLIRPQLHQAMDKIKDWPEEDLFRS